MNLRRNLLFALAISLMVFGCGLRDDATPMVLLKTELGDIKIAIDIISLAYENAYDTAVLVSGDGDFVPVVKKLKQLDKNVEVWAFKYSLANTLKDELEQESIYYLDDILSKIKM